MMGQNLRKFSLTPQTPSRFHQLSPEVCHSFPTMTLWPMATAEWRCRARWNPTIHWITYSSHSVRQGGSASLDATAFQIRRDLWNKIHQTLLLKMSSLHPSALILLRLPFPILAHFRPPSLTLDHLSLPFPTLGRMTPLSAHHVAPRQPHPLLEHSIVHQMSSSLTSHTLLPYWRQLVMD